MPKAKRRYKELLARLKHMRIEERGILAEMDVLWQTMDMTEKSEIEDQHTTWPPPAVKTNAAK